MNVGMAKGVCPLWKKAVKRTTAKKSVKLAAANGSVLKVDEAVKPPAS